MTLFCAAVPWASAVEIQPPWQLNWGETPTRVQKLLTGAKARIVAKHPAADGSEAWDVEGIVQDGLRRTVFYFRSAGLVGVELQYSSDKWTQEKYDQFMGRWRQVLEQRYGQGQLIARKTEPLGDVTQTVVGYQWNENNTAIELVFYSAQGAGNVFRTLSIHYKSN